MRNRNSLFSYSYLLSLSFHGKAICRVKIQDGKTPV